MDGQSEREAWDEKAYAVAVDIGGTFTDLVAYDYESGTVAYTKSPTSYGDFVDGILDCFRKTEIERSCVRRWRVRASPMRRYDERPLPPAPSHAAACDGNRGQTRRGRSGSPCCLHPRTLWRRWPPSAVDWSPRQFDARSTMTRPRPRLTR